MSQMPPPLPPSGHEPFASAVPPMTPGPIGGFANVAKGPDGLAIASLVLGILSVVTCIGSQSCINLPLGIAGLVCGILSKTPGSMRSWGIGLSIAGLVIFLLMFFVIGAAALAFLGLGAAGAAGAAAGGGAP